MAAASGVAEAELSKIERGLALPRDLWLDGLEQAYGEPRHQWYPPELLLIFQRDEQAV